MNLDTIDLEAIKSTQQQTWSSGDFSVVATRIQFTSEQLVESAELRAGWRVLDVATGSGNAAVAAARSGASVVGVDYVPSLLEVGRVRAAAEGLDVTFVEGDAEHLPVETGEFDAVLSVYGAMFAPDQPRAAAEIARACRPGGTIGLVTWSPDGFIGDLFRTVAKFAPPPAGLVSPMKWGDREHLIQLFDGALADVRFTERDCNFRFRSAEEFVHVFERYYGPTNRAFAKLETPQRADLFDALAQLARDADIHRDGGSISIPARYLETVARRA